MQIIYRAIKTEAVPERLILFSSTLFLLFSLSVYAAQPIPPDNLSGHALRAWLKQIGQNQFLHYMECTVNYQDR